MKEGWRSCAWQLARQRPRSEFSQTLVLDSEAGRGVLTEHLTVPDIVPQVLDSLVARMAHNHKFPYAVHGALGNASCAEAVATECVHLLVGQRGGSLQELANRVLVQTASRYVSIPSDRTEDRSLFDPGLCEPATQCSDRASLLAAPEWQAHLTPATFLVSLRFAKVGSHSVGREFQVTYIDAGQFRPPKTTRESNQQQCTIPKSEQVLSSRRHNLANVSSKERIFRRQ